MSRHLKKALKITATAPSAASAAPPVPAPNKAALVDVFDQAAVRNALDDAVKRYATPDGFTQTFRTVDLQLALHSVSSVFAILGCAIGWYYPHPSSTLSVAACVVAYFACELYLQYFMSFKDRGLLVEASSAKGDTRIEISTSMARFDYLYHVDIRVLDGSGMELGRSKDSKHITQLFFEDGELSEDAAKTWLEGVLSVARSQKKIA